MQRDIIRGFRHNFAGDTGRFSRLQSALFRAEKQVLNRRHFPDLHVIQPQCAFSAAQLKAQLQRRGRIRRNKILAVNRPDFAHAQIIVQLDLMRRDDLARRRFLRHFQTEAVAVQAGCFMMENQLIGGIRL